MREAIRRIVVFIVMFSFISSNTAYASPGVNDTLRSISTSNAGMGSSMSSSLLEVPNYINAGDAKPSSSGVITPEDIFEKKLAFALIRPTGNLDPDSSKIFTSGDIVSYIEDTGFEVISLLPVQQLSREDAEEFLSKYKSRPFFKSLVEDMISSELTPVIFRGPKNAWKELKEITGSLSENDNIFRIERPESFERTLEEILFFADRTESPYFIASTESIMKSVLKDTKSQKPSSSGIGNRLEESILKNLTKTSLINELANHTRGVLQAENEGRIKFGTSGFRGIKSLNILTAAITAQANADYIKRAGMQDKVFAVCRDTRQQGDIFTEIAASVFASNGIKTVVYEGYTPTPVIAYETVANSYAGAVNFTASHNPKEYKGYKFTPAHGGAAPQEVTDAIEKKANEYFNQLSSFDEIRKLIDKPYMDIIFNDHRIFTEYLDSGIIELTYPMERYVEYLLSLEKQGIKIFDKVRGSEIQVAASGLHGTAGEYFERVFGEKGINKLARGVFNREPREDFGSFESPEPKEDNMKDLAEVVTAGNNILGVSADGDGDREGVIDINGRFMTPNELASIFYWYLHEIKGVKGGAVKTVATTNLLNALADKFNEKCYEKQVGFKNFMEEMLGKKAIVAAESSAHIGINSTSWDDAFLCALLAHQILSDREYIDSRTGIWLQSLTDILNYIQDEVIGSYFSFYEGKIPADEATKGLLLSWNQNPDILSDKLNEPEFLSILESSNFEVAEISHQPKKGVKIVFTDKSWLCLRPSGTEPLIRLYTEGAAELEHDAVNKNMMLKNIAEELLRAGEKTGITKTSASGKIPEDTTGKEIRASISRAENISTMVRLIRQNADIKERFDRKFNELMKLSSEAKDESRHIHEEIMRDLYSRLDRYIAEIMKRDDNGLAREESDKLALKGILNILSQAEQHIRNIELRLYLNNGALMRDKAPRVLILPATPSIRRQDFLAEDEISLIQEKLGVTILVSDNPLQKIEDVTKGIAARNGKKVKAYARDIVVMLTEGLKDMAPELNKRIGANNTLIMRDLQPGEYVPFSQLAAFAKTHLILRKMGIRSQRTGLYRSAFFVLWRQITGAPFTGHIEEFMNNPAGYIIDILTTPGSLLTEMELKALHEKAARIWA